MQLQPGTSSDKAIDALYAFTDCEVSISPNCCVICDSKPQFLTVSELLRYSVNHTRDILRRELELRLAERREDIFFASLERIFITERMYKQRDVEQAEKMEWCLSASACSLSRGCPVFCARLPTKTCCVCGRYV